ncbi:MAG: SAP domain-containing protein [Planctomycetota bacterium]|jgi:hypothetical protein
MLGLKDRKKSMKMGDVKEKAKYLGIVPGKMKKAELIHTIQQWEGNTPCFGKCNGECTNDECCFITDCLKAKM